MRCATGVFGRVAASGVMVVAMLSSAQLVLATPAQGDTEVIPSSNPIDITPRILDEQARSIVQVGDRMVVGGNFTQIQNAGSSSMIDQPFVFSFDPATGKIDTDFLPIVNGEVTTVFPHPDGDKVWVAGAFSKVNGDLHSRIVLLDLATGQAVSSFAAPAVSAAITDMKLVAGRLYISGDFVTIGGQPRTALATLDPDTGALTNAMNSTIAGTLQEGKGVPSVKAFDVSPNGSRLVAIGNFAQVDGEQRVQLAMWDTSGPTASLKNWATQRLGNTCKDVFPTYLRGIDIDPSGKFFVLVTTGAYRSGQLCDTASRWEIKGSGTSRTPTWVTYTGGDTLTTVEVTGAMAYLGGHMRWLNNPYKGDEAGSGAWPTEGLAVVDTRNGLPFSWNPGRERGLGVFDFLPTESLLWAVSDTNTWAGEFRQRLAAFPFEGGFSLPPDNIGRLPGDVWQLGGVAGAGLNDQRVSGFDGANVNDSVTKAGDQDWASATGAFAVDGTVFASWSNATFTAQPFDGVSVGTPEVIDLYAGDPSTAGYANNFINDLSSITGMFYDPVRARIYYTLQGSAALFWRPFTPESQVVGAARRTLPDVSALSPRKVQGMFLTGGQLFFADRTTGSLKRIEFRDNRLIGTATVVNSAVDWRANALFLSSQWATLAPNVAPVVAFSTKCSGLSCAVDAAKSSDADGGIVSYSVDYGDGTVLSDVSSTHTYSDDGTYSVTVTATDNRGVSSTTSRSVSVARPANVAPVAALSVDCWGLECEVDSSASTDSDGSIVSYDWDFGDSATGSGQTTSHAYTTEGSYSVSVTVTDDRGGVDTATEVVVVNAIPTSITFRAADSADGGSGSLSSVSLPATVQEGDLMMLFVSNGTSRTADTPSGWTPLADQSDDDLRTQVFWRFATTTDLGTVVSSRLRDPEGLAQPAPNTATIAVYAGVDSPPVVNVASAAEPSTVNGGVSAHTTPQVTVPADGQWLVSYWADRTASLTTAWTAPNGQTLRAEEFSSGSSSRVASLLTDGAGPTLAGTRGGLTAVADGASRKATMWSIVLRSQ